MRKGHSPLEAHTRSQINQRLFNLGWVLDEKKTSCNVFQERAKTPKQNTLLGKRRPDYVLYENDTDTPIAVIEAKRPGEDLDKALNEATDYYAKLLDAPLVFAFNDTFVIARHVYQGRPLKIDGEELQDFVDQLTSLRFIQEGAEILSAPKGVNFARDELLDTFKKANNLLRKEGLRDGYERFSAFSEILFLKLIDESERLNEARGIKRTFEKRFCWSQFTKTYQGQALLDFIGDSVWQRLNRTYGDIFNSAFSVKKAKNLESIIEMIDPINLTSTDTDVKGDAFEYFLKSVTNGNKDLGEYFTPRHIVRSVVHLVKPTFGETIYDPFCGTGGFLLEAFKYLSLRVETGDQSILEQLRNKTLYGREITSTARIAKMNMILFGDGHSNVEQMDSLEKPVDGKYDIVMSNIPYSQETEEGGRYQIPSKNADSICLQHIWTSLKPNGRAAVIVPETFLYKDGVIGKTRELIARQSEKLSIVSLPRGVFMPYTPTKTNIVFFKKGGQFKKSHFFAIHNDGFELNTGRKPIPGSSDLKKCLSVWDDPETIKGVATIQDRDAIEMSGNWNLRPYYYMEDIPRISGKLVYLGDGVIKEVSEKINPADKPVQEFPLLKVSKEGVFLDDIFLGEEATQSYKQVRTKDIVYNPYRVNIGSIGVVPEYLDKALVSPAYIVIRVTEETKYPPSYIVSLLKQERYLRVIMNYALSSARASLPFSELARIKVPEPTKTERAKLIKMEAELQQTQKKTNLLRNKINQLAEAHIAPPKGDNPNHLEDFNKALKNAVKKQT